MTYTLINYALLAGGTLYGIFLSYCYAKIRRILTEKDQTQQEQP